MIEFSEPKMVLLILESIEKILIYGESTTDSNGFNLLFNKIQTTNIPKILQDLQMNPIQKIYETAGYIIEKYFESELLTEKLEI